LLAAVLLCAGSGCKKESGKVPAELSLSVASLNIARSGLEADGQQVELTVTSNTYWMATIPEDCTWVDFSPKGAASGKTTIYLSLTPNYDGDLIQAEVSFATADGTRQTLKITQRGIEDSPLLNITLEGKTWNESDTVAVYSKTADALKFFFKDGVFTSKSDIDVEVANAVVYPYDTDASYYGEELEVEVPQKQVYSKEGINASLPYSGISTGTDVILKPSFAELDVNLIGLGKIFSISFCSGTFKQILNLEKPVELSPLEALTLPLGLPAGEWSSYSIGVTDSSGDETLIDVTVPVKLGLGEKTSVEIPFTSTNVYTNLNSPAYYEEQGEEKIYSNCFMIQEAGKYKFLCADALGKTVDAVKADWVWATTGVWNSSVSCVLENLIKDIELIQGVIVFTIPEDFVPGNVIIGALDSDGNIVGSWHIWTTVDYKNIKAGGNLWMDRNLGASYYFSDPMDESKCNASRGFYYHWGCKNPIVGMYEGNRATVNNDTFTMGNGATWYIWNGAVKNTGEWASMSSYPTGWIGSTSQSASYPMSFFDNAEKSPTAGQNINWPSDANPCPHGYEVMTLVQVKALGDLNSMKTISQGEDDANKKVINVVSINSGIGFPSCSYRTATGKISFAGNPEGRYWLKNSYNSEKRYYWLMNRMNCKEMTIALGYGMNVRCVKIQSNNQ